jgi:hypothetical protein
MLDANHFGLNHALPEQIRSSVRAFPYMPAMNNPLSAPEIAAQLANILDSTAVYEVRAIDVIDSGDPSTDIYSALFRGGEVDELAREILRLSGRCRGVYATINPLKPVNFGYLPGYHRLQPARRTTSDGGIPERRELVLDFDSPRAAGHEHDPATDAERATAWQDLVRARDRLTAAGWPTPTVQDSGNGFYLRYKLAPFAVVKDDDVIHRVLEAVGADTTVCNPSRIMRLPGGLNVKGQASEDRPYRYSRIIEVGAGEAVTRGQLEAVAAGATGSAKRKAKQAADALALKEFNEWAGIAPSGTGSGHTTLTANLEERASRYLETIQPAIAGQKGSNPTLWAARVLIHGFRFSEADTFTLLDRYYNPRCSPAWSAKELQHKIADAATKPFRKQEGWALEGKPKPKTGATSVRPYTEMTSDELKVIVATELKAEAEAATSSATAAAPPAPCPYAASRDMRDEINLCTRRCPNQSPVRFEKGGIRFVCYRDCGNGTNCRACLMRRLHKLLKMTDSYLIRTSAPGEQVAEDKPRAVYGAILPHGPTPAIKKQVQRRGGERVSILTEDADGVARTLAGEYADCVSSAGGSTAVQPDVSRFFLVNTEEEPLGRIGTQAHSPEHPPAHLWLLSLPAGVEPPAGFQPVTVAAAIRAALHAVQTVPVPPEGATCYKPTHKSKGWGDEEEREPSDTKCLGPSVFKPTEVAEILNAVGVPVVNVDFDGQRSRTTGIGWALPPLQSAALNIWVGGTAAPSRPDMERVIELARHWLPKLARFGTSIGEGANVQDVLRDEIWHMDLFEVDEKIRKADEQDQAAEAFTAEAESILAAVREQYRGREHEATGLVAYLLA